MVIRVRVDLGQPNGFFGIDRFTGYHSGNLAVRPACIKADPAAVEMLADRFGFFVRGRLVLQIRYIADLKRLFVNLLHEVKIKGARTLRRIGFLHVVIHVFIAADSYFVAASCPQQHFYHTVCIIVVRVRHLGSTVDEGVKYGN